MSITIRHPAFQPAVAKARLAHPALGLLGWLLLTAAAGAFGSLGAADAAAFYAQLARPAWAPPAWLFGPVWSLLYALMAVAAWQVWKQRGWSGAAPALGLYVAQLLANALWTPLFFTLHRGAWALADIALLWLLAALTAWRFAKVRRSAGLLLLPCLAWVGFAAALNFTLWRMNPALLG